MMTFLSFFRGSAAMLCVMAMAAASANVISGMSSTSYRIDWDVVDSSGGTALSASYTLTDSVAQNSAAGDSTSTSYRLQPGFFAPPDFDADGVRNFMDNCTQDANADQRDSNNDGFGNVCDADLNNDGIANAVDLGLLRSVFFTADADADFNGDGVVNALDLGVMKLRFFTAPGPSGTAP